MDGWIYVYGWIYEWMDRRMNRQRWIYGWIDMDG